MICVPNPCALALLQPDKNASLPFAEVEPTDHQLVHPIAIKLVTNTSVLVLV